VVGGSDALRDMNDPTVRDLRALQADGVTQSQVRALQRVGELERVRRGVYRYSPPTDESPEAAHAVLARATWRQLRPGGAVSHLSAAVLHGLPLLGAPPSRVWVTKPEGGHGRAGSAIHLRRCALDPHDVVDLDGVLVTSLARTVVDVSRSASFDQAVVLADAALRLGVPALALDRCTERSAHWPGASQARRVLAFADAASDSAGESVSRVRINQAGLPAPVLQWRIADSSGRQLFTDFAWPDLRTVGEFDGKVKYGPLLEPGRSAADAVMNEKRRENRIRAQGWWLVRWGWADLADVRSFEKVIRQGFANAPRMR